MAAAAAAASGAQARARLAAAAASGAKARLAAGGEARAAAAPLLRRRRGRPGGQALKDEQRFIRHEFEALQKFTKSELDLKVAKMETVVATMRGLHENSQKECLKNSVLLLGVTAAVFGVLQQQAERPGVEIPTTGKSEA
uniref:Uncharacterized protein n=1 Tax=Oryza rufipogon TaxID=4529 RepID=A0A0E0PRR4_ORYRU